MNATYRSTLTALVLLVAVGGCDNSASSSAAVAPAPAPAPAAAAAAQPEVAPAAPPEPDVASMALAAPVPGGKVGVPVDVRYLLAGVAAKDQPAPLDVAFVPRVEGTNLEIAFIGSEATSIDAGATSLVAAKAGTSSVHRRRLTVTPRVSDVGELRVQVSMDVAGGRYSSIFAIPVSATTAEANAAR